MHGGEIGLLFGILGFGFWGLMAHLGRSERMKLYELIEKAGAEGRPVPPELLSRLYRSRPDPASDMRMGFIWVAIGIGWLIAGIINFKTYPGPHPTLFYGPYALFPIPLLVGVAFLLLAWFNKPAR